MLLNLDTAARLVDFVSRPVGTVRGRHCTNWDGGSTEDAPGWPLAWIRAAHDGARC